jgi:hypothetical protein
MLKPHMKISKKQIVIGIIIVTVVATGAYFFIRAAKYAKEPVPAAVNFEQLASKQNAAAGNSQQTTESTQILSESSLPKELNLQMTFYPQAPFGDWSMPWQETCEEASVLLVANAYYGHDWTRTQFNDELLKLVEWEKKYFGDYKHTTVQETSVILQKYLDLNTVIHEDPTFADIQQVLARGHFIIMPFAGKLIGNPNYKNGGPIYHVMVIKGYKEGVKVITADVGTRNGEDYVYDWNKLSLAVHDYAEPMEKGARRMIEVIPPSA